MEEIRDSLHMILKESRTRRWPPEAGDSCSDVQGPADSGGLLSAFGDPDSFFCIWARGVWLGSPARELPRTPDVFDRDVRWRRTEPVEDAHGEWQRNYSSLAEHRFLVQS